MVFNEEYARAYDALYYDKDYERECDYLEAIFQKFDYRPKTILDLGCGTGCHALILAKRGYAITGVDRSKYMLETARKKANDAGVKIEYREGDITEINLGKRFDAVISMFAVMSYHTTNSALAAACRTARNCLVPRGLFMFDCWHGFAVLSDKPTPRMRIVPLSDNERIIRFTEPRIDLVNHTVEVFFRVWRLKGDKIISETTESHPMRFLFPQEIKYFLETAKFETTEFFPFLKLDRGLSENDWNMMVVGKSKTE